jgi:hypothetical protein
LKRAGRRQRGWRFKGLVKPGEQVAINEQLLTQQSDEIGQGPAERGAQLETFEQEDGEEVGPDLNLQGVGTGADEAFDAQILFPGAEGDFPLLAVLIDA